MKVAFKSQRLQIRIAFFTLMAILAACSNHNSVSNNDWKKWNLKGSIQSISEITYSESGKYHTNVLFGKSGFVSEQASYNPDKSLVRKWVINYLSDSLKSKLYCYILNDSLSYVLTFSYDPNHNVISTIKDSNDDSSDTKSRCEYDSQNNKIREVTYNKTDSTVHEVLNRYSDNLLVEEIYFDAVMKRKWKQRSIYNSNRERTQIEYISMSDSVMSKVVYAYNEAGKLREVSSYSGIDSLVDRMSIIYNKMGDEETRIKFLSDGKILEVQKHEYKYDKKNNWTYNAVSINDEVKNVITREIKYYN